jgi:preprotein translocase subunit SecG
MALLWPHIERWQLARPHLLSVVGGNPRRSILRLLGAMTSSVLVYGAVTIQLASSQFERAITGERDTIDQAVNVMQQTTWVFFWVFAMIILFIAFFGYQLFTRWQESTNQLLHKLHSANQRLEQLAYTDGLTGLLNRRTMDEKLNNEWLRITRTEAGGALVMGDAGY